MEDSLKRSECLSNRWHVLREATSRCEQEPIRDSPRLPLVELPLLAGRAELDGQVVAVFHHLDEAGRTGHMGVPVVAATELATVQADMRHTVAAAAHDVLDLGPRWLSAQDLAHDL